jgi:hypothetical protein
MAAVEPVIEGRMGDGLLTRKVALPIKTLGVEYADIVVVRLA